MSLIDASYFVGEIGIPNSADVPTAERIAWFINKYEPLFLQKIMGYPLYKAFVAGMNVIPPATPDIRFLNILYGTEYTDIQGLPNKWKGLIVTDNPVFNLSGGLAYRKPEYLKVGITAGLIAGANTFTFDGTAGKPDWRGWTPVLTRSAIMKPTIDYSWDVGNGILVLLGIGDKFNNNEDFFAEFQLRTDTTPSVGITTGESCIANYVYYWYRKSGVTQFTGIGEVMTSAENSINISPWKKVAGIWNEMSGWIKEFLAFMDAMQLTTPVTYPEWTTNNKIDALKAFGFMNPIF